jgi:hypothetical protein
MTHDVIDVAIEKSSIENLGEMIRFIDGSVDPLQYHEITLDPFGK